MSVRSYPNLPYVFFDMDGVVADFEDECQRTGKPPSEVKLMPGTYRNLPVFHGANECIERIGKLGFNTFLCTKISSGNPLAATEKLLWVRENLPTIGDRVIITPNKGVIGKIGDFLVDDHPEWANCSEFRGTLVKFDATVQSWTWLVTQFETWQKLTILMLRNTVDWRGAAFGHGAVLRSWEQ